MEIDGKPVTYDVGGGVFWIDAKPKKNARLVMRYSLVESRIAGAAPGRDSTAANGPSAAPAFGAYHNTDAWLPFFSYDSGNSFAQITATVRIPADVSPDDEPPADGDGREWGAHGRRAQHAPAVPGRARVRP